jgi:uncharacterized protein (TIGR00369 family)
MPFVADAALSAAVMTTVPPRTGLTTSEMAIDFFRAASMNSGNPIARARIVHSTRSLGLAEVFIEDARGRSLAHGTARCVLFPIDVELIPPAQDPSGDELDGDPDPYLQESDGVILTQADFGLRSIAEMITTGPVRSPFGRMFGLRYAQVAEGEVTVRMPASAWLSGQPGSMYGGAIALLAEYATTIAAATTVPGETAFTSMAFKIHFLRPARPSDGELSATAKVVHRGRKIAIVSCEVTDPEAKLVAMASESVLILPGRPWDRPIHLGDEVTGEEGHDETSERVGLIASS